MTLTAADVAEILRLVEDSNFDELSLEFEGLKLSFRRGERQAEQQTVAAALPVTAVPASAGAAPATAATADLHSQAVISPMLGTFYRAPKPGAPPFVTVGAAVEEDSIVGIIEVMKLMNTVRAQVRGTVAEVLVTDGALVEYGEILLRVRRAV
ncbi:MAG: acetyl-CoA carboxylase biotin carboxyl carrier protein [Gammaproteobacteria bacterium]